jgi:O-acetyl-ADP-ribose deacetylase (regulator of RNase III)
MKIINGDIVELAKEGQFDLIVHGCNCEQSMGAGLARQIRIEFPEAYQADLSYDRELEDRLGTISGTKIKTTDVNGESHKFYVMNGYTQLHARGYGVLADYDAIRSVFSTIASHFPNARIAYPKIGAGLARGDWDVIEDIIDEELAGLDHTLVLYSN